MAMHSDPDGKLIHYRGRIYNYIWIYIYILCIYIYIYIIAYNSIILFNLYIPVLSLVVLADTPKSIESVLNHAMRHALAMRLAPLASAHRTWPRCDDRGRALRGGSTVGGQERAGGQW